MQKLEILIIEDDLDIRKLTHYNLTREGYDVVEAGTGDDGLAYVQKEAIDLILLDLMLPGIDGLEVCRRIRADEQFKNIPIIMLTAKGEESDIVVGLEVGADDYVTKPFSPRVLVARVRAVLRRKKPVESTDESILNVKNIVIDSLRHEVRVDNEHVEMTRTEFEVLKYLAQRPGWVRTRGQIVDAVHGDLYPVTERSVDVQIVGLRKKLGDSCTLIETVRGVGYRFKD